MKRHLSTLLLVIMMLVPWSLIHAQGKQYLLNETFDDVVSGLPLNWSNNLGTMTNLTNAWTLYNEGYEGKGMRFNSYNSPTGEISVLMTSEFTPTEDQLLRFKFKNPRGGNFSVYVVTDGVTYNDVNNRLAEELTANDWVEMKYALNEYTNKTIRIAFVSVSNAGVYGGDAYHYLDDVVVEDLLTCAQPINISISSLAQDSVTINWGLTSYGELPSQYHLIVKKVDGTTIVDNDTLVVTGQSTTITNLESRTTYALSLQADCRDANKGYSLQSDIFYFTTLSEKQVLPYINDFDDEKGVLPEGWIASTTTSNIVELQNDVVYGEEGLAVHLQTTPKKEAYIISPQLDHNAADLEIELALRGTKGTIYIVGLIADPADFSTFEPFIEDTIVSETSEWVNFRVNTESTMLYADTTGVSFMVYIPASNYADVYVDNVDIHAIPTCLRPERLRVSDIIGNGCVVDWLQYDATVNNFQIKFTPTASSVASGAEEVIVNNVTTHPYRVENLLQPTTEYEVRVRAICAAGDSSSWSFPETFETPCGVLLEPKFFEGFEGVDFPPTCWTFNQIELGKSNAMGQQDYGDTLWQKQFDYYIYEGNASLYVPGNQYPGTKTIVATQALNIDAANKYDFSFMYYRLPSNTYEAKMNIYVNTRPNLSGATLIGSLTPGAGYPNELNGLNWYPYSFNIPLAGELYIVMEFYSDGNGTMRIDNFEVKLAEECRRPLNITAIEPTTTTAGIKWDAVEGCSNYEVFYELSKDGSAFKIDTINVTDTNFIFEGLDYATTYTTKGYVISKCGENEVSDTTKFSFEFVTECIVINEFPYKEDFESLTYNKPIPVCWLKTQTGADGAQTWQYMPTGSYYVGTGNFAIKTGNTTAGSRHQLITPQFDLEQGKTYQVGFSMQRGSDAYSNTSENLDGLKVWISSTTDVTQGKELIFVPVDYLKDPIEPTSYQFYDYVADVPAEYFGAQYFIFEAIIVKNQSVAIDNVVVREKPECDIIRRFSVENISSRNVDIVIPAIENVTDFEISYGITGFKPENGTIVKGSGSPFTLTGLLDNTAYEVYLRRDCGNGKLSEWTTFNRSFKTLCDPVVVDEDNEFVEGFEWVDAGYEIAECYLQDETYYTWKGSTGQSNTSGVVINPIEGEKMAYLPYGGQTWMYRPFNLKAGLNYEMSAYVVVDARADATFFRFYAGSAAKADSMTIKILPQTLAPVGEWTRLKGYFNVPKDGTYFIGIKGEDIYSWKTNIFGLDNVRLRVVDCAPPTDVMVMGLTNNSAQLAVVSNSEEFELKVSNIDFDPNLDRNIIYQTTSKEPIFNISGLMANRDYYYSFRSLCNGKPSEWIQPQSFHTKCNSFALPYEDEFDDATGENLNCWSLIGSNVSMTRYTSTKYSGLASLQIKNGLLVSPALDIESIKDVVVEGYVGASSVTDPTMIIGVMLDPEDETTFQPLRTFKFVAQYNVWANFTAFFNELELDEYEEFAGAKHIAFKFSDCGSYGYFLLDKLSISEAPICRKPTQVNVDSISDNSITLSWIANGSESQWNIKAVNGFDTIVSIVDTNPATINGLNPTEKYSVYLSALCSDSEISEEVFVGDIQTACGALQPVYTENFVVGDRYNPVLPSCWEMGECVPSTAANNKWHLKCTPGDYSTMDFFLLYDSYAGSAGNIWYLQGNTAGNTAIIQSPIFNLKGTLGAILSVDIQNVAADSLSILLSKDGGETYDVVLGAGYKNYSTLTTVTFDLSEYAGEEIRIGFKAKSSGSISDAGCHIIVDNFKMKMIEACMPPSSLQAQTIGATSVTIAAQDAVTEHNAWEYVIGTAGFNYKVATPIGVTSKIFTIDNLNPYTQYDVYVRTNCGEGSFGSWCGPLTFKTTCADTIPVPYYEGYEDITSIWESCGDFVAASDSLAKYLNTSTYSASVGTKSLQMQTNVIGQDMIYILPKFNEPVNKLKISFDYKTASGATNAESLVLGVIDDDLDEASFQELMCMPQTMNAFKHAEVEIGSFAIDYPQYVRLALKVGPISQQYKAVYVDELYVDYGPECPNLGEYGLVSVAGDSAIIAVQHVTENVEVAWGLAGLAPDDCTRFISSLDTIVIKGLSDATSYYVYLRSTDGTNTREWTAPILFSTACDVVDMPKGFVYVEDFDDYEHLALPFPACIRRLLTYSDAGVEYPILSKNVITDAPRSLFFYGANTIALPEFSERGEILQVTMQIKGAGNFEVGLQENLENSETFKKAVTVLAGSKTQEICIDFTKYEGITGKNIVFRTGSDCGGISIDTVVVEWAPTCYEPRFLKVDNLLDTTVTISWKQAPDVTKFAYVLQSATDTIKGEILNDTIVFNGLKPLTKYEFLVAGYCGESVEVSTEWSNVVFTTFAALPELPYSTGFEDPEENKYWIFENGKQLNTLIFGKDERGVKTDSTALYVTNNGVDYGYSSKKSQVAVYAYRTLRLEAGEYLVSYDWKSVGNYQNNWGTDYYYDFARVFLAPGSQDFTAGYSLTGNQYSSTSDGATLPNGFIALDGGKGKADYVDSAIYAKWEHEDRIVRVAEGGVYNLVVYWTNYAYYAGCDSLPFTIDNFYIERMSCETVQDMEVVYLTDDSVNVTFNSVNETLDVVYNLATDEKMTNIVRQGLIESNQLGFANLDSDTEYYLFVKAKCDRVESGWNYINFRTYCDAIDVRDTAYVESFETYNDKVAIESCWEENSSWESTHAGWKSNAIETSLGRHPRTGKLAMTLEGGQHVTINRPFKVKVGKRYEFATWFVQTLSSEERNVVAELYVKKGTNVTMLKQQSITNGEYQQVVGEFVAEDSVVVLGIKVNLPAHEGSNATYKATILNMDDITLHEILVASPQEFEVNNVTSNSATFNWSGDAVKYHFQLLSNDVIEIDTLIGTSTIDILNINSATYYDAQVRAVMNISADSVIYSNWAKLDFLTACGVVEPTYNEGFEFTLPGSIPLCWDNIEASSIREESNWVVVKDMDNSYVRALTSTHEGVAKLHTPRIKVDGDNNMLSFRFRNNSPEDILKVTITNNGRKSYDTEVLMVGMTAIWTTKYFDLKSFEGDTIQVAFEVNSHAVGTDAYVAIDDVRVACYSGEKVHSDYICMGNNYFGYGFEIAADKIREGVNRFERFVPATTSEECDIMEVLELQGLKQIETHIYDTICDGEKCAISGFEEETVTGRYYKYFEAKGGCDSIVVLHLNVVELRTTIRETICEGDVYEMGGKEYSISGEYEYKTINSRGCDSIVTLILNVLPREFDESRIVCEGVSVTWEDTVLTTSGTYRKELKNYKGCDSIRILNLVVLPAEVVLDETICEGTSYIFNGKEYTTSGQYIAKYVNVLGCDSIVTLNLVVIPAPRNEFNDYVCEGDGYYDNGFQIDVITQDTVVTRTVKSAGGCDSIIIVNIEFVPTIVVDISETIEEGETYLFGGNSLNVSGEYTHIFTSEMGCDSVVNLTLQVGTDLNSIYSLPLVVAPNPINGGATTYVNRTWTIEEQNGLKVEVLNSIGQVIMVEEPTVYPISIDGISVSGLYYVRITDGTGTIHVGKLIVK